MLVRDAKLGKHRLLPLQPPRLAPESSAPDKRARIGKAQANKH